MKVIKFNFLYNIIQTVATCASVTTCASVALAVALAVAVAVAVAVATCASAATCASVALAVAVALANMATLVHETELTCAAIPVYKPPATVAVVRALEFDAAIASSRYPSMHVDENIAVTRS